MLAVFKVLISLALGIMSFGVFLCFAGSDIDNVDWWYFWFCLAIGIGLFTISLIALFE